MIKKNKAKKEKFVFILNVFLSLFVPFSLSSCTPIKKENIVTSLFPNIYVFISHIIGFIVLIIVLRFLVWKPTKKFLVKKQSFINKTLNEAKKTNDDANNNLNIAKLSKIKAIEEANAVLKKAQNDASKIINDSKNDAKKESLKIINKVYSYLEQEKKQMKKNYQQDVIGTAFSIIENVFSDEKNNKNKQKYISNILNKIKEDFRKNEK